ELTDALRTEFPEVELTARRSARSGRHPAAFYQQATEQLTDRQFDVLETSYAMGYFEWPRDATGQQIADSLDIAQPTFANHLRSAQRKLLDLFFDRGVE
ncbi:MAG: helix-turn-helix domain-containing protein, partial [Halobaculum sp.]